MLTRGEIVDLVTYPSGQTQYVYNFKCHCGNEIARLGTSVKDPENMHCGCMFDYVKDWIFGKQLKIRWNGIQRRTVNGTIKRGKHYEDGPYKDVTICEEWKNSFKSFYDWSMENGFEPYLHIDRIDPKKGYSPDNCRWVTQQENNRNGARSKMDTKLVREVLFLHGIYRLDDIAKYYDVTPAVLVNICKGRLWKDVFEKYGTEKNLKRGNPKYLLPINHFESGTIDFNNEKQLNFIKNGYLSLNKGDKSYIENFEPILSYYLNNIDKSQKGPVRFRDVVSGYYLDREYYNKRYKVFFKEQNLDALERMLDNIMEKNNLIFENWLFDGVHAKCSMTQ